MLADKITCQLKQVRRQFVLEVLAQALDVRQVNSAVYAIGSFH